LVIGNEGPGPPVQFTVIAGFTVKDADLEFAEVAVMFTAVAVETTPVVIVKVTALLPAGISTEGGTAATLVLLLASHTVMPPVGAGTAAVTVPFVLLPQTGALDLITNEFRVTV
jgi:hypothetical protein